MHQNRMVEGKIIIPSTILLFSLYIEKREAKNTQSKIHLFENAK
jgi:hypothetical protein